MTGVPPLSKSIGWTRGIADARNTMLDLQRQLATGKKADTWGGLGTDSALSMHSRARLSGIKAFQWNNQQFDLRLKTMSTALERYVEIGREVHSDVVMPTYDLSGGDRTSQQIRAANALDESLSLLRTEVAGRYLFAGTATDKDPVATTDAILNGAGGKAGFTQVMQERKAADRGSDGQGRLELSDDGASEVTVGEDHDGSFGFKIAGMRTTTDAVVTTDLDAPPREASIDFTGADLQPGETITLTLRMPDGTETRVEIAVVGEGGSTKEVFDEETQTYEPVAVPNVFEVGDTDQETAENFQTALGSALQRSADVELAAASSYAAADDFFNFDADNPPRRVDGPPFDSATGFRNPPEDALDDTVLWYRGEAGSGDPRQTAIGRVDDQIQISYGARANEEALRWQVQNLAVLAAERFDGEVESDKERYQAMAKRGVANMSTNQGRNSPEALQAHIAAQHHTVGKANERHTALKAMSHEILDNVESADPHEVAVKLLQLQTRLEASYRTTAMLSQMSLVYHM